MGFILKNSPTVINIKLTNLGRQLLSQGRLTYNKWAIGDSEIDYGFNTKINFDAFRATILRPKDQNPKFLSYIKRDDSDANSIYTSLGSVVSNTNIITNTATERGFFNVVTGGTGTTRILTDPIHCKQPDIQIYISGVTGGTVLKLRKAPSYLSNVNEPIVGDYILVKWANPLITGGTVSPKIDKNVPFIWYKIHSLSGSLAANSLRIVVDKPTPNFGGQGGSIASAAFCYPNNNNQAISGDSIQTYYSTPFVTDFIEDSVIAFLENCICPTRDVPVWNMSIVFTEEIAGVTSNMRNMSQYFSKTYGGFVRYIERISKLTKKIGIIHFSNNSPNNHYGEGFFEKTPVLNLPTIMWHYETGSTIGLRLTTDFDAQLLPDTETVYRNLVDRFGNVVGKVFNDLKIFVIEDQELLFAMSYKGNRNWTLPRATLGLNLTQCEPTNNLANLTLVINSPTSNVATNGKIQIFATNAISPSYSLNGGIGQINNVFSGLTSSAYTIKVTDLAVPAPNNYISGSTTLSSSNPAIYTVEIA
jgi:hypothetical protein